MGLSGLSASFSYMNFALLIGQIYVFFRVLNDAFHRGKKSGLMHVVAQGGGGKRTPFCRRKAIKSGSAHTHNMKESQDNAADPVHLVIDNLLYSRPTFVIEILPFESDVTILLSRLSYQNVTPASIKHSFAASMTAVLVTVAPLTASMFGVPELRSFSRSTGIA